MLARQGADPGALDDDGVRRNVAGLLVGAIDTTATAVGQIVAMAARHPRLREGMERDVDDPARMLGWCYEALRLWPHNPIVLRQAASDVELAGATIPAGTSVIAYTHAAMFDPSQFPDPDRLDPARPLSSYRHFGGGLHPCAGRAINAVQIPELVRRLVRYGIEAASPPKFEGPFIDELVVSFRGSIP